MGNCFFNKNKNKKKNGVYVFKNALYLISKSKTIKCLRVEIWHENELLTITYFKNNNNKNNNKEDMRSFATFFFINNNILIKSIRRLGGENQEDNGIVRIDRYLNNKYHGLTVIKRNGLVFQTKTYSKGVVLQTCIYNERGMVISTIKDNNNYNCEQENEPLEIKNYH